MAAWVCAVLLAACAALSRFAPSGLYPAPNAVTLGADEAVASASLISLGMRRLAADAAFIRMIVYYGTPEGQERPEDGGHHAGDGHDHGNEFGSGDYLEIGPRARRLMAMDPYWKFPILYAAGALAFNLQRPAEAIELLEEALRWHPKDAKILATIAAVGFHKAGDMKRAVAEIDPYLSSPDTSTMLKNMAAYMHVRLGHRDRAVQLYLEILESRDEQYHHVAVAALERLKAPPKPN